MGNCVKTPARQSSGQTPVSSGAEMQRFNPSENWDYVVAELGLINYFPEGLQLQTVRTVHPRQQAVRGVQDLPRSILEQIMVMDANCRENIISSFAKLQPKQSGAAFALPADGRDTRSKDTFIPHPMDMILILFYCSDFILRQVFAQHLFRNRLAIPFIVPTASNKIEMLVWPLRSIVMEWRSGDQAIEKALVKCNINMVSFVRCGCENVSKSNTINRLLSKNVHDVFFHSDAACGKRKRLITNGTVEVTHFLPAAVEDDLFPQPALFLNLRGDACQYPVQHSLVCDLATVLVIFLDISNLDSPEVQSRMDHALIKKQQVIAVISNVTHRDIEYIHIHEQKLIELEGNIGRVVTMFDQEGSDRNIAELVTELRDAIRTKMEENPNRSIEQFACDQRQCLVDENTNQHCSNGKSLAERVLSHAHRSIKGEKQALLPCQGDSLNDISKLLRDLHRCSGKDCTVAGKHAIKTEILNIRRKQAEHSQGFMEEVMELCMQEGEVKAFEIRWLQMELDDISRDILPPLQEKRRKQFQALMSQRKSEAPNSENVVSLEKALKKAERDLDAATFGLEHLLREMAQMCEVEAELKQVKYGRSLPQIVSQLLFDGHPVEMMDGDHGLIPITWLKAVFQCLSDLIGKDKQIIVLSVMGIQSSGKSTLLNTMFNLEFAVGAGRSTRGIFAQLLPVDDELKFNYMLILDSEGLRAQGMKQHNYQHDNELATLVIGIADLVIVNLKGENVTEVKDILQIAVQAFLRMKLADAPFKRKCMFIHQNVAAVNAIAKLAGERQNLQEQLDSMTEVACQAQDLPQALTSFDQLIEFDADKDVVYFPDLWNGNPPMATCNPRYSLQASKTRQQILETITQARGSTVENFVQRMTDMWYGVLTDDFVFSFRNSIATKAYKDLEREFSKLLMEIERDVLQFLNVACKADQQRCETVEELQTCNSKQMNQMNGKVAKLHEETVEKLNTFFKTHPSKDVMAQWKSEKEKSLALAVTTVTQESKLKLDNMHKARLFELREQNATLKHEQMVIAKSKELAEKLRGKNPPQEELEKEFQTMWATCVNDLDADETGANIKCPKDILTESLWEVIGSTNGKFLTTQLEQTPVEADSSLKHFPQEAIKSEHFTIRGRPHTASKERQVETVAAVANEIMTTVLADVDEICHQDILFDAFHGKKVIHLTVEEVEKHNANTDSTFSFSPDFTALLAVRVACCAAPKFDQMNAKYEEKHGVKTKLNKYKERVFKLFENAVKDTKTEVIASTDFCEVIKGQVIDHIRTQLDQRIMQEIHLELGFSKFDLIVRILEEIADNRNFKTLMEYIHGPSAFSEKWMRDFGKRHIFPQETPSIYTQFAGRCVKEAVAKILSSTKTATETVNESSEMLYRDWVAAFCDDVTTTIPINSTRLNTNYELKNLSQYQKSIESSLRDMETAINDEFKSVTAESVQWANKQNPIQQVFNRLWGCQETCPFCLEPCQYTDTYHATNHRCIQHRPPGVTGAKERKSGKLALETCTTNVASGIKFNCAACSYQCRKSDHCDSQGENVNWHRYREYHKYTPHWDIPPDPACEAATFWQWIMSNFKAELLEKYPATTIEIPDSWEAISPEEAKYSLREYIK